MTGAGRWTRGLTRARRFGLDGRTSDYVNLEPLLPALNMQPSHVQLSLPKCVCAAQLSAALQACCGP